MDLLGVIASVPSLSQTARRAGTAGEAVSTSLSCPPEADGSGRALLAGSQQANVHARINAHIYIVAAPWEHFELVGSDERMMEAEGRLSGH